MSANFQYDEKANSKDLTDEEIAGALSTSCAEDIAGPINSTVCPECGKGRASVYHERRFRFPHVYSRALMTCPDGHTFQKVFQVTWMHKTG